LSIPLVPEKRIEVMTEIWEELSCLMSPESMSIHGVNFQDRVCCLAGTQKVCWVLLALSWGSGAVWLWELTHTQAAGSYSWKALSFSFFLFFFFLVVLGTLHFLGRHSATWATPPVPKALSFLVLFCHVLWMLWLHSYV
jgi:hypothetical protein